MNRNKKLKKENNNVFVSLAFITLFLFLLGSLFIVAVSPKTEIVTDESSILETHGTINSIIDYFLKRESSNFITGATISSSDINISEIKIQATTVTQLGNSSNMANIEGYNDPGFDLMIEYRWNISSIPAGKIMNNATLCVYRTGDGGTTINTNITRITDQTWTEATSAATINAQTRTNRTSSSWKSSAVGWACVDVTPQVSTDYGLGNSYASIRIDNTEYPANPLNIVGTSTTLRWGGPWATFDSFASRTYSTGSQVPYLNITYSDAPGDSPPTVTLSIPTDGNVTYANNSANVTFQCNTTDDNGLVNVSLYLTNASNQSFSLNQTTSISGTTNSTTWYVNLSSPGNYTWNCLVFDNATASTWGTSNRSLSLMVPLPPSSSCGTITSTTTLLNDVSSTNTCFTIGADSITLDCVGYAIKYATTSRGYAVNNTGGYSNVVIKNCNIEAGVTSTNDNYGIYFNNSFGGNVSNNSIYTNGSNSNYGVYLDTKTNLTTIHNNSIITTGIGNLNVGIILNNSNNENITSNIISVNGTQNNYGIYFFTTSNNSIVNSNTINTNGNSTSNTNIGIYLRSKSGYHNISDNIINTNGNISNYGIYLTTNTDYNVINNNTIITKGTSDNNHGIYLFSSVTNNNLTKNNITTNGTSNNNGIEVYISTSNSIFDNIINTNNYGELGGSDGVLIDTRSHYTNITGNTINANGTSFNYGISNLAGSNYTTVNNNTVTASSTSGSAEGVHFDNSLYFNITNNIISVGGQGNNNLGIAILTSANYSIISNNIINTTGGSGNHGIQINTKSSYANVSNNIINTNGTFSNYGIYLVNDANYNSLNNNTIITKGTALNHGLYLVSGVTNNNITHNIINVSGSSSNYGIYLSTSANYTLVDSNNITAGGTVSSNYAIYISASSNNTFLNNNFSSTSFQDYDLFDDTGANSPNYLIYNNSFGEIRWTNTTGLDGYISDFSENLTLNITNNDGLGLGRNLFIGNNTASLNTTAFASNTLQINSSANITLYTLNNWSSINQISFLSNYSTDSSEIRQKGTNCTNCFITSFSGGTLLFNVIAFSSYAGDNVSITTTAAPNTTLVYINAPSANNYTTDNLTCYANITDADNSTLFVNYTWYNNSVEVTRLSGQTSGINNRTLSLISTVNSKNTTRYENWTCSVQAFDGINYEGDWNNATITINNTLPQFTPSLTNQTVQVSSQLYYDINATEYDNTTITYYSNSTLFSINSVSGLITYTPSVGEVGVYNINISAADDVGNTTGTFILNVTAINSPPNVTLNYPINNTIYTVNDTNITLNATITDQENNVMNVSFYADNTTLPFSLVAFFANVTNGSTLTYNWSSPSVDTVFSNDGSVVGYWKFDEKIGTSTADSSGQGNVGTLNGGAVFNYTGGKIGGAALFDGSNDYVSAGSNSVLQISGNLTITWWQKLSILPSSGLSSIAVSRGANNELQSGNFMYSFGVKNNSGPVLYRAFHENGPGNNTEILSTTSVVTNTWTHVAIIRNTSAKTYQFIINGIPEATQTYVDNPDGGTSTTTLLGATLVGDGEYIGGHFDEIAIFNRSLTSGEVRDLYRQKAGTYYWRFNATDGNNQTGSEIRQFTINAEAVANIAPNTTLVYVNTTSPNNYTTDNLTCYVNISDSDNSTLFVNYTWYNNTVEVTRMRNQTSSVSTGVLSLISTINYGNTTRGENWTCSVQAFDGIDYEGDWNNATITINNTLPQFTPSLTNQTISSGSTLIYDINYSDNDSDVVSFSDNTSLFVIDVLTGIINFTPSESQIGTYNINISINDSYGNITGTFILNVTDGTPPTFSNAINTSLNFQRYQNFTSNITITDGIGLNNYIFSTNVSGSWINNSAISTGSVVQYNASTNTNISQRRNSNLCWYYSANDSSNNNASSETYCFTVQNTAPTFNETFNIQNIDSSTNFTFRVNATDIDDDNFTYYVNDTIFVINNRTGIFNFSTNDSVIGRHLFNVTIYDGSVNVSQTLNVTINDTTPPTFSNAVNTSLEFQRYQNFTANITITDGIGLNSYIFSTNVSGSWINNSAISTGSVVQYNASTNTNISQRRNSNLCWYYSANDSSNNNASSETYCFTVSNTASLFNVSIGNHTVVIGNDLNAQASCSDIDDDTITYSSNASLFSINSANGTIRDTPTTGEEGTYYINVTCNDGQNEDSQIFSYTIQSAPVVPITPTPVPSGGGGGGSSGGGVAHYVECSFDQDCGKNGYCEGGSCKYYQCTKNSDCKTDEFCVKNVCVQLFDLKILYVDSPIQPGDSLDFTYFMKAMSNVSGDVALNFNVGDVNSPLSSGSDVIFMGDFEEKIEKTNLFIPSTTPEGAYPFTINLQLGDYVISSHRTIEIKKEVPPAITLTLLEFPKVSANKPFDYTFLISSNKDEKIVVNTDRTLTKSGKVVWQEKGDLVVENTLVQKDNVIGLDPGIYQLDVFATYGDYSVHEARNITINSLPDSSYSSSSSSSKNLFGKALAFSSSGGNYDVTWFVVVFMILLVGFLVFKLYDNHQKKLPLYILEKWMREMIQRGYSEQKIREILLRQNNWSTNDINKVIARLSSENILTAEHGLGDQHLVELKKYISSRASRGDSPQQIATDLMAHGWKAEVIEPYVRAYHPKN